MEQDRPRKFSAEALLKLPALIEGRKAVDTLLTTGIPLQNHNISDVQLEVHPDFKGNPKLCEMRIGSDEEMTRITISLDSLELALRWNSEIHGLGGAETLIRILYPHFLQEGDTPPNVNSEKGKDLVEKYGIKLFQVIHLTEQQFGILQAEVDKHKSQTAKTILAPVRK